MICCDSEAVGQLPAPLICSVVRLAERNAEAVANVLDMSQSCPVLSDGTRWSLPRGFLLELTAMIQLRIWEQEGFRVHIEQGLPSYEQAAADLWERCQRDPLAFKGTGNNALNSRMLEVYWRYCVWEADVILGRTVAIQIGGEDELAAAMAAFLWENRECLCAFGEEQSS